MKNLSVVEKVIAIAIILGGFLFFGYMAIEQWVDSGKIQSVSEWKDIFDMDCPCGNHLHAEPCDINHYRFICGDCGIIYEKDWKEGGYPDYKEWQYNRTKMNRLRDE